ncbi:MAG: YbaN family protein [Acidimicrobiales bacterium]|nr:YbaN family protein [Acidimicrobiales bacterium]
MSIGKNVLTKAKKATLTLLGFACVVIGIIGIVVPGLPTTVFMIIAAWLFSISNPRFEKWLLNLPKIGPAIQNFRNGLGMPIKAKIFAVSSIFIFTTVATILLIENLPLRVSIIFVAVIGIWYITSRVPTREKILEKN